MLKVFRLEFCDVVMSRQCIKHKRFNKFIKVTTILFQLANVSTNLTTEYIQQFVVTGSLSLKNDLMTSSHQDNLHSNLKYSLSRTHLVFQRAITS